MREQMTDDLERKELNLRHIIADLQGVAVAYSGGVDSSYLLAISLDVLGTEHVVAYTADSPLLPRGELETARQIATMLGATHRIVPFDDLSIPEVAANPPLRCYHCKWARFQALVALAREAGDLVLIHGENADDKLDYRPGSKAADELGIRAPLAEAGLTKADIRVLSRRRELPTWDHPAAACLATRFPYNVPLTREGLERVERAEKYLRDVAGVRQLRLRDHHPVARIEVPVDDIPRLASDEMRERIVRGLLELGYLYVTLDLDGYRMGSMNDNIETS
jgi:uncharacterized protein